MKKFFKSFFLGLIIGLLFVDAASAGNNFSFSVSCTIPVIPGVNAPLIEEQTVKPKEQEEQITETKEEQIADTTEQPMVMVKTIYDR